MGRHDIVKMWIPQIIAYKFNKILNKIHIGLFIELYKLILKFVLKYICLRIAKSILKYNKEGEFVRDFPLSSFNTYKATVIS